MPLHSPPLRAILWVKWLVSVVVPGRTWDKSRWPHRRSLQRRWWLNVRWQQQGSHAKWLPGRRVLLCKGRLSPSCLRHNRAAALIGWSQMAMPTATRHHFEVLFHSTTHSEPHRDGVLFPYSHSIRGFQMDNCTLAPGVCSHWHGDWCQLGGFSHGDTERNVMRWHYCH